MQSKGLVIVYDPHNLYQFVWYYATYGYGKNWDALCLPNESKGEYMSESCKRANIFENVMSNETEFSQMKITQKICLFAKMVCQAIVSHQEDFCKKFLNTYFESNEYDTIVVLTDVGMISGMSLWWGREKEVIILEDGWTDYLARHNGIAPKKINSFYDFQGYFLAKMGYCNPAHIYPLKTTKYCHKYSKYPELMRYTDYASIEKLLDFKQTDMNLFDEIIRRIYPELTEVCFDDYSVILFGAALRGYTENAEPYVERLENYISDYGTDILMKKHPRDTVTYSFEKESGVLVLPSSIPAEVLTSHLAGKKVIFASFSSTIFYVNTDECDVEVVYFRNLADESLKSNSNFKYDSKEVLMERLNEYGLNRVAISEI